MDENGVTVTIRRDAAFYLSMLLGDQILSITDCKVTAQFAEMLGAYEHAREKLECALNQRPPSPATVEDGGDTDLTMSQTAVD